MKTQTFSVNEIFVNILVDFIGYEYLSQEDKIIFDQFEDEIESEFKKSGYKRLLKFSSQDSFTDKCSVTGLISICKELKIVYKDFKRNYYATGDSFVGLYPREYTSGFTNTKIVIAFDTKEKREHYLNNTKYTLAEKCKPTKRHVRYIKNCYGEYVIDYNY